MKEKKAKTNLKKKVTILVISIIGVLALVGIYIAMQMAVGDPEDTSSASVTRNFVYPNISRSDVDYIKVTNSNGSYKAYRIENKFYFEGAELVTLNSERFSSLVVNSTYMLSMYEIEDVTDLSLYGLDLEEDNPAYVEIGTLDGAYHKVYIGDLIPTGGGYYALKADEDSSNTDVSIDSSNRTYTVYVLDSSIGASHLGTIYDYLQPYISIQISSPSEYVKIDDFYFSRRENDDDEKTSPLVKIRLKTEAEKPAEGTIFPYLMEYPTDIYTASTDAYSAIQASLAALVGTRVVDYGIIPVLKDDPDTEKYNEYMARLEKWGLDKPKYEVIYSYDGDNYYITFSKPDENGMIYAYTMQATTVIEIPLSSIPFLDWDIIKFVDKQIFTQNINTVQKITTTIGDTQYVYDIISNADGQVTDVYADGQVYDVKSFKQYYLTFLQFYNIGYAEPPEDEDLILQVDVKCNAGPLEYKFYRINSRDVYYTINGEGEFYVNYDIVKQMLEQTEAISNNELLNEE